MAGERVVSGGRPRPPVEQDVAGAYVLTSWIAAALVPIFSWRILWLIGWPTGVLFIGLNRWIPESPRFLLDQDVFHPL